MERDDQPTTDSYKLRRLSLEERIRQSYASATEPPVEAVRVEETTDPEAEQVPQTQTPIDQPTQRVDVRQFMDDQPPESHAPLAASSTSESFTDENDEFYKDETEIVASQRRSDDDFNRRWDPDYDLPTSFDEVLSHRKPVKPERRRTARRILAVGATGISLALAAYVAHDATDGGSSSTTHPSASVDRTKVSHVSTKSAPNFQVKKVTSAAPNVTDVAPSSAVVSASKDAVKNENFKILDKPSNSNTHHASKTEAAKNSTSVSSGGTVESSPPSSTTTAPKSKSQPHTKRTSGASKSTKKLPSGGAGVNTTQSSTTPSTGAAGL
jgi:hypothetical protein